MALDFHVAALAQQKVLKMVYPMFYRQTFERHNLTHQFSQRSLIIRNKLSCNEKKPKLNIYMYNMYLIENLVFFYK